MPQAHEPLPNTSRLYDSIFNEDPFLLQEENQSKFGDQILRNLLVERAIAASDPFDVTLNDTSSRSEFKSLPQPSKRPLSQTLRDAYLTTYRSRSPIKDKSIIDDLQQVTMVADGEKTTDRRGDRIADHETAKDALAKTLSPMESRLTIATIGYRVRIGRIFEKPLLDEELGPRVPAKLSEPLARCKENKTVEKLRRTELNETPRQARWSRWFESIRRHISLALEKGAHFVVLPEYCLPPDLKNRKTSVSTAIRKLANDFKQEFFLFSGSRHEGVYNRGFIVFREKREDVLTKNWWHYKMASARGLGENIMGAQNWKLPTYNFTIAPQKFDKPLQCRVCVAICYDIFDPTTFINYVVQCVAGGATPRETIILVPSFNPSKEFVHALRDLSFIAKCPVIYVNGLHGDARLFLYGFAISDLAAMEARTVAKEKAAEAEKQVAVQIGQQIATTIADVATRDQGTTFDEYFSEFETNLDLTIKECDDEVDTLQIAAKAAPDPLAKKRLRDRSSWVHDRSDQLKLRAHALKDLARAIKRFRKEGKLQHLMTKESCPQCELGDHADGDYCANDLLYYNIDPGLMLALKDFRNDFFVQDDFLPLPFRGSEQDRIFDRIDQKKTERAAKASRKRVN
jgi:predicted amidohydrolase